MNGRRIQLGTTMGPWLALHVAVLALAAPCAAQTSPAAIRHRIEQLRSIEQIELARDVVPLAPLLIATYQQSGFAPLWNAPSAQAELRWILRDAELDGLDPLSYGLAAIESLAAEPLSEAGAAHLDVLRTSAVIALIHDLRFGRARPPLAGLGPEFAPSGDDLDATHLRRMIASDSLRQEIGRFRPNHFVYHGLAAALARLRAISVAGGWQEIPGGPPFRRDDVDVRVPALRRRLAMEGFLPAGDTASPTFDAGLDQAVRSFQHHHGLNEDGIVGIATLSELNVTLERRLDQIRVNLERARWLRHDLPDTFVGVNSAAAKVYLVRGGQVVFETRAVVGKAYTKTPNFSGVIRTIELNPTWTVPRGIVDEVLTQIRRDPGYLERERMRVLDSSGQEVDPNELDFFQLSSDSFPYTFRQEPGATNPLGRIKFLFPNPYDVYLHDSPQPDLFEEERRTFSHGCIRVAEPTRLGELVLDDPTWSMDAIESAIALGKTQVLRLQKPVPVLVFYWTASADEEGTLHLYRDVYGQDGSILRDLAGPVAGGASEP